MGDTPTTWQSGRESRLLDDIIAGRKTIEGRLNRGKFAQYQVGDIVELRRDVRGPDGILRDGDSPEVRVEIVAIRRYQSFLQMASTEGFVRVIPSAKDVGEAAKEYDTYYSIADQTRFGVVAIEIKYLCNIGK